MVFDNDIADYPSQAGTHADAENPAVSLLRMPCCFRGALRLHHKFSPLVEEYAPGPGQLHAPVVAYEEPHTQLLFQLMDLAAEGWLRNVQPLSSLTEVEGVSDGDKVADMTEFHSGRILYQRGITGGLLLPLWHAARGEATPMFPGVSGVGISNIFIIPKKYNRLTKHVLDITSCSE